MWASQRGWYGQRETGHLFVRIYIANCRFLLR
jgi:hypothetical protein